MYNHRRRDQRNSISRHQRCVMKWSIWAGWTTGKVWAEDHFHGPEPGPRWEDGPVWRKSAVQHGEKRAWTLAVTEEPPRSTVEMRGFSQQQAQWTDFTVRATEVQRPGPCWASVMEPGGLLCSPWMKQGGFQVEWSERPISTLSISAHKIFWHMNSNLWETQSSFLHRSFPKASGPLLSMHLHIPACAIFPSQEWTSGPAAHSFISRPLLSCSSRWECVYFYIHKHEVAGHSTSTNHIAIRLIILLCLSKMSSTMDKSEEKINTILWDICMIDPR